MNDHYAALEVSPTASREEITRSYRRLARRYHPDLLHGISPERRRLAEETLKRINLAHSVLADPQRRAVYDRERARTVRVPSPGSRQRTVETTRHWGASGPIDIAWSTPPPRRPRPDTDVASPKRLLRGAIAIVLFAVILALLWRPGAGHPAAPTPTPLRAPAVLATPTGQ